MVTVDSLSDSVDSILALHLSCFLDVKRKFAELLKKEDERQALLGTVQILPTVRPRYCRHYQTNYQLSPSTIPNFKTW